MERPRFPCDFVIWNQFFIILGARIASLEGSCDLPQWGTFLDRRHSSVCLSACDISCILGVLFPTPLSSTDNEFLRGSTDLIFPSTQRYVGVSVVFPLIM